MFKYLALFLVILVNPITSLTIKQSCEIIKDTKHIASISNYKNELFILYNNLYIYREVNAKYFIGRPLDPHNLYSILEVNPYFGYELCRYGNSTCLRLIKYQLIVLRRKSSLCIGVPFDDGESKIGIYYLDSLKLLEIAEWIFSSPMIVYFPFQYDYGKQNYVAILTYKSK